MVRTQPGRPHPSVEIVFRSNGGWRSISPGSDIRTTLADLSFLDDQRVALLGVGAGLRPLGAVERPELFLVTVDTHSGAVSDMVLVDQPARGTAVAGLGLQKVGADSLLAWWLITEPGGTVITPELHTAVVGLRPEAVVPSVIERVDSSFHIGNVRLIEDAAGPLLLYVRSEGPLPTGPVVARRWRGDGWSPARELGLGTVAYFDAHFGAFGDLHLVVSRPERRSRFRRAEPRETIWRRFERSAVHDWFH